MSPGKTGIKKEQAQEGLNLANILRDYLAVGVVLVDARKKIVALGGEVAQMLGLRVEPRHSRSLEALPVALRRIIRETLSSGKPIAARRMNLGVAGRGTLSLLIHAQPLQLGRSRRGVAVVLSDLTSARRHEPNLRSLDRLASIGTLSASAAHEIKNALVAGKTFIDLLLEKEPGSELTEIVRRELSRIDSMVTQMLRFAGPSRPAFSEVRVHEILEHSLRLVQPRLLEKSISLSRSFHAVPDLVEGDDGQLQQAFVNLFLNALDAMGPHGTLTVGTEIVPSRRAARPSREPADPKQLRVIIQDTGAGIPPELMDRLFEPFFTTKPSGTGLGLPITKSIIHEHHGAISVESAATKGTIFSVVLPARLERSPHLSHKVAQPHA